MIIRVLSLVLLRNSAMVIQYGATRRLESVPMGSITVTKDRGEDDPCIHA